MENNTATGEILSFIELLEKHEIEIPIIQRDYAQGRGENKYIRLEFLNALKESVIKNKKLKLDFIYGEIVRGKFQPLDGQQRLTTLFLLHWYAIAKESKDGKFPDKIRDLLSKFTYETRISSREFCECLVEKSVEINVDNKNLKKEIIDTNWFYLSWKQDPSIDAMLNTLNDINEMFGGINDLWEILTGQKLITFHYLNLKDLGLSDDLYIKMNARGKQLTPFENFKAQLQKIIEDNQWEKGCAVTNKFDFKIDTCWTDFFWKKFGTQIDAAHIKFISAIIMNRVALSATESSAKKHEIIQQLNDNNEDNGRYLLKFIDKEVYDYIYLCYELFSNLKDRNIDLDISESEIKFWNHAPDNSNDSILSQIASVSSSYTQKALFFAQIEFLRRNETFDRAAYLNWMRVIRNYICFSNITVTTSSREDLLRDPDAFASMSGLINTLAEGCGDIYAFLADSNENIYSYRREQTGEEIAKAKKIKENPAVRDIIWKLEDLDLFRGRISFVFECAEEATFRADTSEERKLKKIYDIIKIYFNESFNNKDSDISVDFNRAMLTIDVNGDYGYYNYWDTSYWYMGNAYKRKFIFNLNVLQFFIYNNRDYGKYLIALILKLFKKNYQDIINDFIAPDDMPGWKKKLIAKPNLLQERESDFFAITGDNKICYLLKSQRPQFEGNKIIK